ncbi:OmpA family protein [Flavobacterium sp. KBS0721]|uniref:OmpA family protein n=1 Tax=Flavobacterium sp. KBS0721 TaxID=1179672 RepID=UPI00098ECB9F|nr:OmpA family protein [Flavobacterium sp. KBS0721]QDW22420.1 OmpA family protein [Flavobacterium sp. KBS0721]
MIYKKLKITFIFLMVCIMQIGTIQAQVQDKNLEKANAAYTKFAFIEAIKLYNKEIKKGNNTIETYTKLGDCYYYNANYPEAAKCYAKIMDSPKGIDPQYYFRYAQALNNNQNYKESEQIMKTYYSKSGKKDLSADWNGIKLMEEIKRQSGRYIFKPVAINSPFSDFGACFNGRDKVIYASAKDTGTIIKRKHSWNEKSFLKLYSADITVDGGLQNSIILKGDVNTRYHQSTPAITKDGKLMYFTRNNYVEGKLGADKEGTTYLKIYVAENVNGEWKNIKELGYPINSDGFSSAHPALSADESELYFVSDRNNKFGNSDIYVVSVKKNGRIGNDITKLGDEINTLGRETYPFVDASGILYFSSDGHPGLGGLDVFAALKDDQGKYHVVNLGDGVNTNADDFAYTIQDDTKKGYFSSNRTGNDDIYSFTELRPVDFNFNVKPIVSGTLKYTSGTPIEGMVVEVYNSENEMINTVSSGKDGIYTLDLKPYRDYRLVYKKLGIAEKTQIVTPQLKPAEKREYSFDFINEMQVIVGDHIVTLQEGDDLTHKLKLDPIYFDYNGFKIRESSKAELNIVVELMKARPSISLKINSHTDSRGRDDFNMKLSENRAKATVDYIVAHGIEKERVHGQGYGETNLINRCTNGVKCSEAEHQENRRSEFIIHVNH